MKRAAGVCIPVDMTAYVSRSPFVITTATGSMLPVVAVSEVDDAGLLLLLHVLLLHPFNPLMHKVAKMVLVT